MEHTEAGRSASHPHEQNTAGEGESAPPHDELVATAPQHDDDQITTTEAPPADNLTSVGQGTLGMLRTIAGWICIVAGLMTVCLPIPIGLPLIALGIFLIGPDSPVARRVMQLVRKALGREPEHPEREQN